ncbi:MAG: hypothetical protein BGO43_05920 [Gammaproteobacteria bacterium 39-13]|nr:hypothetical protein [Gammaproteobacteria bacterium]OJV90389.1 MAG: hypothetical protein BGO43_05920 [Gammaproteobacteria bacterium 39-13]
MVQITFSPIADMVGIAGVGLTLLAYFLLHANYLTVDGKWFSLLNLIGASFVQYSLFFDWNTPAVIMEASWILISLYGTIKAFFFSPR